MRYSTIQSVFVFFVVSCMAHGSIAQDIGIPSVSPEDDGVIDLLANRLTEWQATKIVVRSTTGVPLAKC